MLLKQINWSDALAWSNYILVDVCLILWLNSNAFKSFQSSKFCGPMHISSPINWWSDFHPVFYSQICRLIEKSSKTIRLSPSNLRSNLLTINGRMFSVWEISTFRVTFWQLDKSLGCHLLVHWHRESQLYTVINTWIP